MMLSASTSISPAELEARLRLHRLPEIGRNVLPSCLKPSVRRQKPSVRRAVPGVRWVCRRRAVTLGAVAKCVMARAMRCAG